MMNFNKISCNYFYLLVLVLITMHSACNNNNKKQTEQNNTMPPTEKYKQLSPIFNADSAYAYVKKQVSFGPRVTGTPEHKACGDWLVNEFKKYKFTVIEQKATVTNWDNKKLNIRNIIASFNPSAAKRILICAHWDSRPYADQDLNAANHQKAIPAADDGASGVAVMLEIARILAQQKLNIGVDFICFDAEDLGKPDYDDSYCLGSQYWGANLHTPGYKANYGILLDMVGAYGATFALEGISKQFAEHVLTKVWQTAQQLNFGNYFLYTRGNAITDDHLYINKLAKIPTIDIINTKQNSQTGFGAHWHTMNDDMNIIDKNTLTAVGQTLLEVLYTESN